MHKVIHQMLKSSAVILLFISGSVYADFKSDIIQSCTAYQQGIDKREINACKLYIDGFIDSSLFSENAVTKPEAQISQKTQRSDYLKRAYETRLMTTSSMLKDENAHEFCIPLEYDRKEVASQVAKSMNITALENSPLKQVLFETLVAKFPCQ